MPLPDESIELLGPDGPFVSTIAGFQPRASQASMAAAVGRCLEDDGVFVVESGTGTGKTFAYLVPAILSGKRIIISTGTKPLQDQLFHRDLPAVMRVLGAAAKVALLKGRANYLCVHRLQDAVQQAELIQGRKARELAAVEKWSHSAISGDLNQMTGIAEDSPVRAMVTSTTDNCLGAKCRHYEECYVNKARRSALAADILIINHHLFCADLVLREDGFGQLLPGADAVIFDEAHHLAEVATNFLGVSVSSNQVRELCRDTGSEEQREQSQVRDLPESLSQVERQLESLHLTLRSAKDRLDWDSALAAPGFEQSLLNLVSGLSDLADSLELAASAGEGLMRCWQRALRCAERLSRFTETSNERFVRWVETGQHWFRLHETPLHLGETLGPYLRNAGKAWFYTSATLSVKTDFSYFCNQLGIDVSESLSLVSPFDYKNQAQLYIPSGLPDPRQAGYLQEIINRALPVIEIVGGRTFFLFTSHSALREAHEILRERLDYQLLVQGQMPRTELLEQFRSTTGAVLLGTSSFWEGVDVPGEALSCVIIDKLPFESPTDPVLRARLEVIESTGDNPFLNYQLPRAVIALKQGVGRLIRDREDFGVLMLCDPRLITKGYGKVFLKSLPDIPLTRDIESVRLFFQRAAGVCV